MQYRRQPRRTKLVTYSDADWAGCRTARKITTGGCIKIGDHCVKGWSNTQTSVALSSGESESYASLKASAETLGILSMLRDLRWDLHGEVLGDANAALGIVNRSGLGKIRHIDAGLLWIQQVAAEQRLRSGKVLGINNPADLFTKHFEEKINSNHTISRDSVPPKDEPRKHPNYIQLA